MLQGNILGVLYMSLIEIARSASGDRVDFALSRLRGYSAVAALIITISVGYLALGSLIHSVVDSL